MFVNPEELVRGHQADLLDEACRGRRAIRLARVEGSRHRAEDAAAQQRLAAARAQ